MNAKIGKILKIISDTKHMIIFEIINPTISLFKIEKSVIDFFDPDSDSDSGVEMGSGGDGGMVSSSFVDSDLDDLVVAAVVVYFTAFSE